MIYTKEFGLKTSTQFEIIDITDSVREQVKKSKIREGAAVVFSPHTTAAIRINHNEPLLQQDIMKMLYRIVPIDTNYAHDFFEIRTKVKPDERSNGHAHVKTFLLGQSESVPVLKGELALGPQQSIFFVESDGGRPRRVIIQIIGE